MKGVAQAAVVGMFLAFAAAGIVLGWHIAWSIVAFGVAIMAVPVLSHD